jgi:hypothetical protein
MVALGIVIVGGGLIAGAVLGRAAVLSPACAPSLVPAYLRPDALIALTDAAPGPRLLIVNPASGPGEHEEDAYRDAIERAQARGARVLGYVPTTFGTRAVDAVLADAERYHAWYGVDGIFLDEVTHDDAHLPYYEQLSRTLRAAGELVLNPGMVPARGYFDLADVVVTYEGPFADYATRLAHAPEWLDDVPKAQTAHLVYAASLAQARELFAATPADIHLYVTSGVLPDPWGSPPPPYLREEAQRRSQECS